MAVISSDRSSTLIGPRHAPRRESSARTARRPNGQRPARRCRARGCRGAIPESPSASCTALAQTAPPPPTRSPRRSRRTGPSPPCRSADAAWPVRCTGPPTPQNGLQSCSCLLKYRWPPLKKSAPISPQSKCNRPACSLRSTSQKVIHRVRSSPYQRKGHGDGSGRV